MMHRIKDMLCLFMTEFPHKKNVPFMLLMLLYMYSPLKLAYANCNYMFVSEDLCLIDVGCTTKKEAKDVAIHFGKPPIPSTIYPNCFNHLNTPLPCGTYTICWSCPGYSWCPTPDVPVVRQCSAGDLCCLKPDDPCCKKAGGTGSSSNVPNAVVGN